jgi:hypothetical protein
MKKLRSQTQNDEATERLANVRGNCYHKAGRSAEGGFIGAQLWPTIKRNQNQEGGVSQRELEPQRERTVVGWRELEKQREAATVKDITGSRKIRRIDLDFFSYTPIINHFLSLAT